MSEMRMFPNGRAVEMRCGDCNWWVRKVIDATVGQCRAAPPTSRVDNMIGVWPQTTDSDWCGQFTRDARKVQPK